MNILITGSNGFIGKNLKHFIKDNYGYQILEYNKEDTLQVLDYKIKNSDGNEIIVVQIAGLVARRIVTEVSKDELVEQGSRIGMIRFGSRADIYFENYTPLVKINQKTIAGETLIAKK